MAEPKMGSTQENSPASVAVIFGCQMFMMRYAPSVQKTVRIAVNESHAGDDHGTTLTWTVDATNTIKALRIYWEAYQREGDEGAQCVEDKSRTAPAGGIPFLKVVDAKGTTMPGRLCYMTYGDSLIRL